RRSQQVTDTTFQKKLKSIFQANKREYASNTIWLATSISQISQISLRFTVEFMQQQDISTLHTNALSFGVLVDESTRGEAKYFVLCYQFWNQKDQVPVITVAHFEDISSCNANTVSNTVTKFIQQDGLSFDKCAL
ncbi:14153_t:CDS:2, partial [Funneliformis caledonium]